MPRYQTTVPSRLSPGDAFDYMAAFEHVADWDPGVTRAERLDSGPPGRGSRFRVYASVAGRAVPLEYTITDFEPPRRVVLSAETSTLRSVDEIVVEPAPDGATVTYDANLELLGLLRWLNPGLGPVFKRIGDRAAAGLRRQMRDGAPTRSGP